MIVPKAIDNIIATLILDVDGNNVLNFSYQLKENYNTDTTDYDSYNVYAFLIPVSDIKLNYSATEVEFNDGLRSYYYKKCYCSVELQGEYIIFTSHRVENNAFRQQWSVAYTDFTSPTGSSMDVYNGIKTIIENYAGGGTGGGSIPHGTASGTDTYTVTISGVTSYNDGDAYLVRFPIGNTTGATLNINSLGARDLYRNNDGPLIGGDIEDGGEMLVVYNTTITGFQCIGTSPNTILAYVTNADSVTITKGQPVYAFGGTGDRMTVKRANNSSDATSAQTVGLVFSTSIAANQKGFIMLQGLLDGLSTLPTSTWADGDPVFLGATAGSITNVKPYAPNHLVYLGFVTTASPGAAGRMYVRVQNGYELDELHDVQAQSPADRDTLYFDSTVTQWKTASIATIAGNASASSTGVLTSTDWSTFNNKLIGYGQYRKASRWYTNGMLPLGNASFGNVNGVIRYVPVFFDQDVTITRMGINVNTIGPASSVCRVGIYSNDPATTQPLTRLVDAGTMALDSTGVKSITGLSVALTKGLYWFAYFSNAASGTITGISSASIFDVKGQANIGPVGFAAFSQSLAFTTLPATAGTLTETNSGGTVAIYYYY